MSCGIYKIENNVNHMIYIGQSINIENRFIQHKNNKNNYDIHVALREYGIENFSFDIIELCNKKELNEREIYWISYYNCQKPNGYNCTPGGTGWNPAVEASKIRVAQYDLDGNFIKEFESISDAERQTLAGHISDVLDKENKKSGEYMWLSLKNRDSFPLKIKKWQDHRSQRKQPIYQLDKNTEEIIAEFDSAKDAAIALGLSGSSHIVGVLNGKRKTCAGYKWRRKE